MEDSRGTTIENIIVNGFSQNPLLDTFLNSRLDGKVGQKRKATTEALIMAYGDCTPEILIRYLKGLMIMEEKLKG